LSGPPLVGVEGACSGSGVMAGRVNAQGRRGSRARRQTSPILSSRSRASMRAVPVPVPACPKYRNSRAKNFDVRAPVANFGTWSSVGAAGAAACAGGDTGRHLTLRVWRVRGRCHLYGFEHLYCRLFPKKKSFPFFARGYLDSKTKPPGRQRIIRRLGHQP
jgi:hypothetical protein